VESLVPGVVRDRVTRCENISGGTASECLRPHHKRLGVISNLTSGFISDWRGMSPPVAVLRALRASRVLGMADVRRHLRLNPAYQRHVASVARDDTVFFLSHRHYLAKGLSPQERAQAAVHHYEHEMNAFDSAYFDAVYGGHGLVAWQHDAEGDLFEIRILPGNDVLYEGGCSIVAFFNGVRIAVLSYANVSSDVFLPGYTPPAGEGPLGAKLIFVTRKQLTWDHALYQKSFNKAFDRSTPGHFCFAALTALALAQGHVRVVAITPDVHPSCTPEIEERFRAAYTEFWESMGGRRASPYGHVINLPMRLKPLDELDAKARKRAIARRGHIQAVQDSTFETIRSRLVAPPALAGVHDADHGQRLRAVLSTSSRVG
jgi:uncharacterized protein